MDVTKEALHKKFQELIPDAMKHIKPELFGSICNNPTVQPFLAWFMENVSQHNILTEEEKELVEEIKMSGNWLTGQELDNELEKVLEEYPEIKDLVISETQDIESALDAEIEKEKEKFTEKWEYLQFLENQNKKLKQIEIQQGDILEQDDDKLDKYQNETGILYNKCTDLMEHFDNACQEFSASLNQLVEIYKDVSCKNSIYTWIQMPLDTFIKSLDTYSSYLERFIKIELGETFNINKTENNETFMNVSESDKSEHMESLTAIRRNLMQAKYKEIENKIESKVLEDKLKFLEDLSNNELSQVFKISGAEKSKLKATTEFLGENIKLLYEELTDAVDEFAKTEENKFLAKVAQEKIDCQKLRLEKLEKLTYMAREKGHAFADLLCLLMSSQGLLITELYHFAQLAWHHFQMEYSFSKKRCDIMQKIQEDYNKIQSNSNEQNIFNKLFSDMMGYHNDVDICKVIEEYEMIIKNNEAKKNSLKNNYSFLLEKIVEIIADFSKAYNQEFDNGLTRSFQPINNDLLLKLEETRQKIEHCQSEFATMHKRFKEVMNNINASSLDREKVTLWQTFLVDPESLQCKYDDLKTKADELHFKDNLEK